jgi:hypothetical protein
VLLGQFLKLPICKDLQGLVGHTHMHVFCHGSSVCKEMITLQSLS